MAFTYVVGATRARRGRSPSGLGQAHGERGPGAPQLYRNAVCEAWCAPCPGPHASSLVKCAPAQHERDLAA